MSLDLPLKPQEESPTVNYLISLLDERIRSGVYAQGHRLPSERSLCAEFDVCRPTVRQALDELERRRLIQRAARRRPLVWNGEGLRETLPRIAAPRSIGLWISGDPTDRGPAAVAQGVYQALEETTDDSSDPDSPWRLVMACPRGLTHEAALRSEELALRRMAADDDLMGIVLWYLGGERNLPALQAFRASGKALIFVDRRPPEGFDADFVGIHNTYSAAEAVRHLAALGHRRIAHITNSDTASSVAERLEGYKRGLRETDLPFRPEWVLSSDFYTDNPTPRNADYWHHVARTLCEMPEAPTAVFAVNDYSAHRLITALRELGRRVPEDISILGFDGTDRWLPSSPFLSSVEQPFTQIGAEAVGLLKHRLQQGSTTTYQHLLLPAPVVLRSSCAPPAA